MKLQVNSQIKSVFFVIFLLVWTINISRAATTSWKGLSTNWSSSFNWTNGVPTATSDVIIGDENFTGLFQPLLTSNKNVCKSLTIGAGSKVSILSITSNNKNLTVSGDIFIGPQGTIYQAAKSIIYLTGNWTKTGIYSVTHNNAEIFFSGKTVQNINSVTTFQNLTISSGSTTVLNANIFISKSFTVAGTFDPNGPTTYKVTFTGATFTVNNNGNLRVRAANFTTNYGIAPILRERSIVDYCASNIDQSVAILAYGTLTISGGTVKTVVGNFNVQSSAAGVGNINVTSGTLDLADKIVNRSATGSGSFTVANGCTLKLQGTFPANFATYSLAPTSLTHYYGGTQTVKSITYGHLLLTIPSGTVTKTLAAPSVTVSGNLTTSVTAGTLTVLGTGNLTVAKITTLGNATVFSGSAGTHTFGGDLVNNGTFSGGTGSAVFSGLNAVISGFGNIQF